MKYGGLEADLTMKLGEGPGMKTMLYPFRSWMA